MKYQRIKLTLNDGRETFWCGPVQIKEGEEPVVAGIAVKPEADELPPDARMDDKARILTVKGEEARVAKNIQDAKAQHAKDIAKGKVS